MVWNKHLASGSLTTIQSVGFQQFKADYSVFIQSFGDSFIAVVIYIDDMVITGNEPEAIKSLKRFLRDRWFQIKDLGQLKYFLSIEVVRFKQGIAIF